jgi:methyl-accepting chemotaxis protein
MENANSSLSSVAIATEEMSATISDIASMPRRHAKSAVKRCCRGNLLWK